MWNEISLMNQITFGKNRPFVLIAGPCMIESESLVMETAEAIKDITEKLDIPYVFKASFDKANRSSIYSERGPGLEEGLAILQKVKEQMDIPITTDVHDPSQVDATAEVADIIQIPAFLCRQTDLLVRAAKTEKVINVKKGQFLAPGDMKNIVEKLIESGNERIMLTERGTTFGYNNLVVDMRALSMMRELGVPIVFDATHSVQVPGGLGISSDGKREFVPPLSRAAVAVGIDALFVEVHPNPDQALCDGPNMLKLADLEEFLKPLVEIDAVIKETDKSMGVIR